MSKTVNRGWLRKQVNEGKMLIKCCYHMTDDYKFDADRNFGKTTEWVNAKEFNLSDRDFKTKSGAAWIDENDIISLVIHSNRSYDLKKI